MKALGITFSARKEGNCLRTIVYCLKKLKKAGYDLEALSAHNLNINPCNHCNYECFSESDRDCPIKDDVRMIYDKIKAADLILFAVPNYSGHPSGLYRAWFERGCMLAKDEYENAILPKSKGFIIIGNLNSGGDQVLNEVLSEFYNRENKPGVILLEPREFSEDSINSNLIEHPEARIRLDRFIEKIIINTPQNKTLEELVTLGINKKQAQGLIQDFPLTKIRIQIDALPYRKAKEPASILIRSIEENWASPADYEPQKEDG